MISFPYTSQHEIRSLPIMYARLNRLYNLNLIERVKRESPCAAKYYRLSIGGVYNLIFKRRQSFLKVIKRLFQNYSHNIIFTSFLYPHFAGDTVVRCTLSSTTLQIICSYVYDCCELTERELDSIKQKPRPSLTRQEAAFVWDKIPVKKQKLES
jgi:hypothetical protein